MGKAIAEDDPSNFPDVAPMNSPRAANSDGYDGPEGRAPVQLTKKASTEKPQVKSALDMLNEINGQVEAKATIAAHMMAIKNSGKTAGIPRNIVLSGPQSGQMDAARAITKFYAEEGLIKDYHLISVDAFRLSTARDGTVYYRSARSDHARQGRASSVKARPENAHMLQAGYRRGRQQRAARDLELSFDSENGLTTDESGPQSSYASDPLVGLAARCVQDNQHIPVGLPGLNIVSSTEIQRYCGVEVQILEL